MKKTAEILITTLMLGALYLWSPLRGSQHNQNSVISNSTGEVLLLADGTDPMPGKKR